MSQWWNSLLRMILGQNTSAGIESALNGPPHFANCAHCWSSPDLPSFSLFFLCPGAHTFSDIPSITNVLILSHILRYLLLRYYWNQCLRCFQATIRGIFAPQGWPQLLCAASNISPTLIGSRLLLLRCCKVYMIPLVWRGRFWRKDDAFARGCFLCS